MPFSHELRSLVSRADELPVEDVSDEYLDSLEYIEFSGIEVSDEELGLLSDLKSLRAL